MSAVDQLMSSRQPFLNDGGIETELIFRDNQNLPLFSAFMLLETPAGTAALERYFERYLVLAESTGRGLLLDTATWRANAGWAERLQLSVNDIRRLNRAAVDLARKLRDRRDWRKRILVNGNIGPAGDGYAPDQLLTVDEAIALHRPQIETFAEEGVDLATALTITHAGEAIGVVSAARSVGLPVAISFTVETDGRLPTGQALGDAIAQVEAETLGYPLYYGINCAHPTHFMAHLPDRWLHRIGLIRPNASAKSHAELDEATSLDDGDPADFGALTLTLSQRLPALRAFGGCCGTDCRHVAAAVSAGV